MQEEARDRVRRRGCTVSVTVGTAAVGGVFLGVSHGVGLGVGCGVGVY